ncbi:GNAT family N-acetyltransferase [Curtobacterium ammoniigenes]|uniref:GNAT family N-acetyltransferase n=1 Tax=Curtobacterium ammoniigenes TaxID=395387 RepID=UPI0008349A4E|nr:GNAT family N-acetyltransferase [Curtobacterium ammoniigenes]
MAIEFRNETDQSRYAMYVDGNLVSVADYRINGDSIAFPHTYTVPTFRGKGYAADVVGFAIDDVEENSARRVVPMCWYVGKWFDEHPDRAGLLTR